MLSRTLQTICVFTLALFAYVQASHADACYMVEDIYTTYSLHDPMGSGPDVSSATADCMNKFNTAKIFDWFGCQGRCEQAGRIPVMAPPVAICNVQQGGPNGTVVSTSSNGFTVYCKCCVG